ncbi:hypothetical protein BG015_009751, partial [Linnemannia schmuckeri]
MSREQKSKRDLQQLSSTAIFNMLYNTLSHRVSIDSDDNNFPKIFPPRCVEFLDKLKGHKRHSDEQQSQTSKKMKANDPLPRH